MNPTTFPAMLALRISVLFFACLAACNEDGGSGTDAPPDTTGSTDEPTTPTAAPDDDEPTDPGDPADPTNTDTDTDPADDPGPPEPTPETGTHGAVSLELLPGCEAPAGVFNFPDVATAPVSGSDRGESWTDGEVVEGNEISVDCTWTGAMPYRVTITIGDRMSSSPRNVGMSFTGEPGLSGSGTLRLQAPELPEQYGTQQGGQQCEFSFMEFDAATGSIWGSFSCPAIIPIETSGQDACEVGPSYFYMRNCEIL